jgi:hypothetical protein
MLAFAATSVFSSIDIGYRNLLPLLPLICVFASQVVGYVKASWQKVVLVAALLWLMVGTVRLSPHYLAFFNELVGGPTNGYRYLVDSNLDWGQDLKNLTSYMEAAGIEELHLSYFGVSDPSYYGLRALPMPTEPPPSEQPPSYYAISATSLQGVYGSSSGQPHWLAQFTPMDSVGYSILIYRLPQ